MSEHEIALRAAEARVTEAQAALELLERQYAAAARDARDAASFANGTPRDAVAVHARRFHEASVASARVAELEQHVADARAELGRCEAAAEAPRTAAYRAASRELEPVLAKVRAEMARAVAAMAETVSAVIALRRVLSEATSIARRMGGSSVFERVEAAAFEVLRASSKLRPESLAAPELVRDFEAQLRTRGVIEGLAGLHRLFRAVA